MKMFCIGMFLVMLQNVNCLSITCGRCKWWKCPKTSTLACVGDPVKDICSCCYECGLLEGKMCGDDTARCIDNLYCRRKKRTDKNGVCSSKYDQTASLGLPPCYENLAYNVKVECKCQHTKTTFCTMDCKSCCSHRTTCNPNRKIYQDVEKCKVEQDAIEGLPRKIKSR